MQSLNFESVQDLYEYITILFKKWIEAMESAKNVYGKDVFATVYTSNELSKIREVDKELKATCGISVYDGRCYPSDIGWVYDCATYEDYMDFWDKHYDMPMFLIVESLDDLDADDYIEEYYMSRNDNTGERLYLCLYEGHIFPEFISKKLSTIMSHEVVCD